MVWFRENWYEELLRQLMEGLSRCQAVAFENRTDGKSSLLKIIYLLNMVLFNVVTNTQVTPELKACIHKLIGAFGISLEQTAPAATSTGTAGQPAYDALDFKLAHNLHTAMC